MRALNWVAIFACLWVLFMLAGCPGPDPVDPIETTEDTGASPTVDPALAITSVSGAQEGPDVLLTFHTATPVTRTVEVSLTWFDQASAQQVIVPIEEGAATVAVQIINCDVFDTTQALVVLADGLRFEFTVPITGVVADSVLSPTIEGEVWATCAPGDVFIEGSGAAYEFRGFGILTGGGDSGEGKASVPGVALLWLESDRVYTWEWSDNPPHLLMVRFAGE